LVERNSVFVNKASKQSQYCTTIDGQPHLQARTTALPRALSKTCFFITSAFGFNPSSVVTGMPGVKTRLAFGNCLTAHWHLLIDVYYLEWLVEFGQFFNENTGYSSDQVYRS
jgi:hypothetical protein